MTASAAKPLLRVDGLIVRYGRRLAVNNITLSLDAGEIVAVVGPNGAGKSSTMQAVQGLVPLAAGRVQYAGQDITGQPAHRLVRQGLVYVPEGRELFGGLTVAENLAIGAQGAGHRRLSDDERGAILANFPMLAERLTEPASSLSGGQAQMLALARALTAKPTLLMLDEPTLGLSPRAAREVLTLVRGLPAKGISVLLVEQSVRQALRVSQRAYVMEHGAVTLEGPASEIAQHAGVAEAYLGTDYAAQ
ncbi:MAG: ATP-binding cassette domain-containing protein [Gammaproteobacteria bacterium]|nr:ATP-binding cassette domain-containing protein [Gammaproteobacteria bacterium]